METEEAPRRRPGCSKVIGWVVLALAVLAAIARATGQGEFQGKVDSYIALSETRTAEAESVDR